MNEALPPEVAEVAGQEDTRPPPAGQQDGQDDGVGAGPVGAVLVVGVLAPAAPTGGRHRLGRRPMPPRRSTAWVAPGRGQHGGGVVHGQDRAALVEPEQVGPQLLGRGVAVGGVLGHRLQDDGLEGRGDRRVELPGCRRVVADVLGGHRHRGVARGTAAGR